MKKLIQKCLVVTLLILSASQVKAQWAVFDANNFTQTLKLAGEAAQQTKYLSDTYKEIKKANEVLTKISNTLSNVSMISEIIQEQMTLVGRGTNILKNIRNNKNSSPRLLSQFTKNIDDIMIANKSNVEFLKSFMKEGLSMSDGERLQLALEVRKQTKERDAELKALDTHAKQVFETLGVYKSMKR
jgi:hypothetical protein